MATAGQIPTALLCEEQFLVDDHFFCQLDDLFALLEEIVEIHFGGAEAHEEENGGHEVDHLEDIEACAFGVCYTWMAACF
jgi:hypothetical protein